MPRARKTNLDDQTDRDELEETEEMTHEMVVAENAVTYGAFIEKAGPRIIRKAFGLTQQEMARAIGISLRKLSALETQKQKQSAEDRRRYTELDRLREGLGGIMQPEGLGDWLRAPNEYFDGFSPMELLQRGEIDRIWRLIWRMEDGVPLD